jgi:hypothetical protein
MIDESDSEASQDEQPHITNFNLGRFCAARTQIFHKLSHWNVGRHLGVVVPTADHGPVSPVQDAV